MYPLELVEVGLDLEAAGQEHCLVEFAAVVAGSTTFAVALAVQSVQVVLLAVALVQPFTTTAAVVSTLGMVKVNVFAPLTRACEPVAGIPLPKPAASTADNKVA